jgi:hypothetical protein
LHDAPRTKAFVQTRPGFAPAHSASTENATSCRRNARSPFQSLVQAVAHQQLNGTAANTILTRFKKLFPGRKFPRPEDLAKVTDKQIRACGFSFAKIKSIRDIAEKTLVGTIPSSRQIVKLPDDEIIARLTEVRGVGRWTVEMLLIFQLGRPMFCPWRFLACAPVFASPTKSARCRSRRNCSPSAKSGNRTARRRRGFSGARRTRRRKRSDGGRLRFGYKISFGRQFPITFGLK